MKTTIKLFALIVLFVSALQADLKTDLINIKGSILELNSSISTVEVTAESMCAPLISINQKSKVILDQIIAVNDGFSTPVTLDDETLPLMQELFVNMASVSQQMSLLSSDIALLQPSTDAVTLKDGITAMLQLSSDIAEMADRIGEMADNILIMSDNIGLMAERIIETQVIQSENLVLTQNSALQTQSNALALVNVVETASYNLTLDSLVTDGEILVAKIALVSLNPLNMSRELEDVKIDVKNYLQQVKQFQDILNADRLSHKIYINSDSLNSLVDLAVIMTSIGTVMDGYGVMINAVKNLTSDGTLSASMESMLSISADIGTMSNSVLEMADLILSMSDNIGLEADQILLTQELQSVNIATAQASVLAAQILAIGIIASIN